MAGSCLGTTCNTSWYRLLAGVQSLLGVDCAIRHYTKHGGKTPHKDTPPLAIWLLYVFMAYFAPGSADNITVVTCLALYCPLLVIRIVWSHRCQHRHCMKSDNLACTRACHCYEHACPIHINFYDVVYLTLGNWTWKWWVESHINGATHIDTELCTARMHVRAVFMFRSACVLYSCCAI